MNQTFRLPRNVGSIVNLSSVSAFVFLFIAFIFVIIVIRFLAVIPGPHSEYLLILAGILALVVAGLLAKRFFFRK
jgi:hypothetical protein